MPPLITPAALARTYNHRSKDPWDAVRLYREAMSYSDDWGAQRVASAINSDQSNEFDGISRSEVRAWVDGNSKPDAVHAVDIAQELGWDDKEWTETVRALAKLVVGVYAFGSIVEANYVPSWSPGDPKSEAAIEAALETVGVGHQHVARDDPWQGDEIKPAHHATRLGRALAVAGAPIGDKNAESVSGLPEWIAGAPMVVQMELAVLFVRGRGSKRPDRATLAVQADRPRAYFEDVATLIERVTGESVTASDSGVTISAAAVRELGLA